MNWKSTAQSLGGEALGTFLLVVTVLITHNNPIVVGATIALILFLTESAGHINPVTTLIRMLQQTLSPVEGVLYITAQVLAALVALALYKWVI